MGIQAQAQTNQGKMTKSKANKTICIFCGANPGSSPAIIEAAKELCDLLIQHQCDLVYGGSATGLMGIIADRFLDGGRKVIGIRPEKLIADEASHQGLTDLIVTDNMSDRKAKMIEMSDVFIALPGGTGTLNEIIETFTLHKIGFINKPSGILNTDNFYRGLDVLLDNMVRHGFLQAEAKEMMVIEDVPRSLLKGLGINSKPA